MFRPIQTLNRRWARRKSRLLSVGVLGFVFSCTWYTVSRALHIGRMLGSDQKPWTCRRISPSCCDTDCMRCGLFVWHPVALFRLFIKPRCMWGFNVAGNGGG